MATTLAMLESKATTAEKLILMLRQQIGEARAAQVVKISNFFLLSFLLVSLSVLRPNYPNFYCMFRALGSTYFALVCRPLLYA